MIETDDELLDEMDGQDGDEIEYEDDIDEELLLLSPEGDIPGIVVKAEFNPLKPKRETGIINKDWEELAILVKLTDGEFSGDVVSYRKLYASKVAAANNKGMAKKRQGGLKGIATAMDVPLDTNAKTGRTTLANLTAKMEGLKVVVVLKKVIKDGVAYSDVTAFRPAVVAEAEVG